MCVGLSSLVPYEFRVLSFLNSVKQFLNIGVSPAVGYVEVDCVVNVSKTNSAKVFRVNVIGCSQVKQQISTQVHWWEGGGRTVAWSGQISEEKRDEVRPWQ
jgi:hypothetical protein